MGPAAAIFLARTLGPWGGVKRSDIIKVKLQRQFQIFFIPISQKKNKNKNHRTGVPFCRLGQAPMMGLGDAEGQKYNFSEHGHVAYQI